MLLELRISNFAIIEQQVVSFGPGLNVISGETGAGKSIVLQALGIVVGKRPSGTAIRSGAEGLEVEALFDTSALAPSLREELPEIARGEELVLARSFSRQGRGRVYVNGRLASVALLEEIASRLINICGQGHAIRLLQPNFHLDLVDDFVENEELRLQYGEAYTAWRSLQEELQRLRDGERNSSRRRAELEFLIDELSPLDIHAGTRLAFEEKIAQIAARERLLEDAQAINECLGGERGILSQLAWLKARLRELVKSDKGLEDCDEFLDNAQASLKDFDYSFSSYVVGVDVDQVELERARVGLAELARVERKYRCNDEELERLLEEAKREFDSLEGGAEIGKVERELEEVLRSVERLAAALSKRRIEGSSRLVAIVEQELEELNMKGASLECQIVQGEYSARGMDKVELLISSNRGEPAKPLAEIASGGELSRIMLVLKKVLQDRAGVNVLIFDEVDSGVSGRAARAVGEKLKALAETSQVLCITHLAQVASLADNHFLVEKEVGDRTRSLVRKLSQKERVEEVARMLAGHKVTEAARQSARELMETGKRRSG